MCYFRNRYIYVFGGTQFKTKVELEDEEEFNNQVKNQGSKDISETKAAAKTGSSGARSSPSSKAKPRRPTAILEENEEDESDEEDDD